MSVIYNMGMAYSFHQKTKYLTIYTTLKMADIHYSAFQAFQLLVVPPNENGSPNIYRNEKGLQGILKQEGHLGYL